MEPPGGFEPPTYWLRISRYARLSHGGTRLAKNIGLNVLGFEEFTYFRHNIIWLF